MKICSKCNTKKSYFDFGKHSQTKDGYKSRCKECNALEMRIYYAKNSDSVNRTTKKWIENNRLKHNKYVKKWEAENSEYKKELCARWTKQNKDLVNAATQKRRAIKKFQLGDVSKNIVKLLLSMQKNLCINCQSNLTDYGYHIDHIMPISLGGMHEDKNLQLLCPTCNMKKSNKDPIAWANENGRLL